mmetsp:Transcript_50161/g.55969  ORF Transcript_50161/g.55969 Transcript_50161/m.55969 type:complete len:510 (+) Transcript_50161:213-1742(+)
MLSKDDGVNVKDETVEEAEKEEESGVATGDVTANADEQQATTAESVTASTTVDQDADEGGDSDKKCRVYVGNLAWEVSWQDLKDLMKTTNHEVVRVDVMQTSDGRSKGCAIVEFATSEGAAEAVLTLNDTELSGRQIFVREDRETSNSTNTREQSSRGRRNRHSGDSGRGGGGSGGGGSGNKNSSNLSSNPESQPRRVYVGNLSWDVTWPELKDHMRTAGEVLRADVISEHNGRSKGCGIVEYATEDEARQAIETLTHTELRGRTIFVREDREGGGGAVGGSGESEGGGGGGVQRQQVADAADGGGGSNSVYVWNLSYDVSWQDLKDHMRKTGNVDQATVLTGNDGSSIGCGIVVYQSARDAQRAIRELQETDLNGRPVRLREDRVSGTSGGRGGGGGTVGGRGGGGKGGRGGRNRGGRNFSNEESVSEGTQLYVGNLSYDTTWRDLKDHFKQSGEVIRADVKTSDSGRSKGFGIVRFVRREDAESAIASLGGVELDGRPLEVRTDHKA